MRDDLLDDAVDVLRSALTWELPEQRWPIVGRIVDELEIALDTDDEDGVAEAVLDLEQAGPIRGISAETIGPASDEHHYRISMLIHSIEQGASEGSRDETPVTDAPG